MAAVAMITAVCPCDVHAEIFHLQGTQLIIRLDTDFYANYYPDLKAKYGYNAHKLLEHYLDYGMFERRIPSMYYLNNMDALALAVPVPSEVLYQRKTLRKNLTRNGFEAAYNAARREVTDAAHASFPTNMLAQMNYIANTLYNKIRYNPGVPYTIKQKHYNDPLGVFGYKVGSSSSPTVYGASSAGVARATGLCLNILAIPYQHVNENTWKQQFVKVNVNGVNYIIDPLVQPFAMLETDYVRLYPPYMW